MSVDASIVVAWLAVFAAAVSVVLVAALVARFQARHQDRSEHPVRLTQDDVEGLDTHAATVAAQAVAAEERAAWTRERFALAESERDKAWQASVAAQQAYLAALHAAAEGRRAVADARARAADAGDERDRMVSRAALAAYRRGDLTLDQLREVYRRTSGWDPAQEVREREAESRRATERAAREAYDRAAADARQADQAVRVAEAAADALIEEAAMAAAEAEIARASTSRGRRRTK